MPFELLEPNVPLWHYLEPRERICAIVRHYAGCSLSNRRDELAALEGRDFPDTEAPDVDPDYGGMVVQLRTNCATFALGVLGAACLSWAEAAEVHPLLVTPSQIGTAVSWIRTIGFNRGVLKQYVSRSQLRAGVVVRYWSGGNNDHIETLLSDVDIDGTAEHGGGGRANNEITVGRSNILTSYGRPIVEVLDICDLLPARRQTPAERAAVEFEELRNVARIIPTRPDREPWSPEE